VPRVASSEVQQVERLAARFWHCLSQKHQLVLVKHGVTEHSAPQTPTLHPDGALGFAVAATGRRIPLSLAKAILAGSIPPRLQLL
jgi:phosphoketolase